MRRMLKPLAVFLVLTLHAFQASAALSKQDELLVYHANFGTAAEVRRQLDAGANPDAVSEDNWPAISLAAMRNDEEGIKILRMLVDAGANLNVRDANGETPLMNAITNNNAAMVKYMIEQGANFRATSKSGRDVLSFAQHYATEDVVSLITTAIRLDEERIKEGRSRKHLYRMMDDFVYYNCALQYLSYNMETRLYPQERHAEITARIPRVQARIAEAQMELEHNFEFAPRNLGHIATETQNMIHEELEALISTRNRLKYGVGKDEDLDKRCKKVLDIWRESFAEYEREQEQIRLEREERRKKRR